MTKRAFGSHRTSRLNLCMCVATPYAYVVKHDTVIGSTSVRGESVSELCTAVDPRDVG
jgi:hypothetical protein